MTTQTEILNFSEASENESDKFSQMFRKMEELIKKCGQQAQTINKQTATIKQQNDRIDFLEKTIHLIKVDNEHLTTVMNSFVNENGIANYVTQSKTQIPDVDVEVKHDTEVRDSREIKSAKTKKATCVEKVKNVVITKADVHAYRPKTFPSEDILIDETAKHESNNSSVKSFKIGIEPTEMVVVTREPEAEPMLGDAGSDDTEQNACRDQAYKDLTSIMRAAPLEINSLETCLNLLTTAISLQDITLVKRCIEYLNKTLSASKVLHVYGFLHKCQMPTADVANRLQPSAPPLVENENIKGTNWVQTLIDDLRENCLMIIDRFADHLLKQPELLQLTYKDIHDIVTRDTLRVSSERIVYNLIYNWGVEECNRMTLSKHHLPEVLRQLRYAPRYGLMKRKEFKRKMEEILEEKDWRRIKFYLEEKSKNRRVDELPNKMSTPRIIANKPIKTQINAKERLTRCERCVINVLTCWTAIFD